MTWISPAHLFKFKSKLGHLVICFASSKSPGRSSTFEQPNDTVFPCRAEAYDKSAKIVAEVPLTRRRVTFRQSTIKILSSTLAYLFMQDSNTLRWCGEKFDCTRAITLSPAQYTTLVGCRSESFGFTVAIARSLVFGFSTLHFRPLSTEQQFSAQ